MKQFLVSLLILMGLGAVAEAAPFIDANNVVATIDDYTLYNRHSDGDYDEAYGGYKSSDDSWSGYYIGTFAGNDTSLDVLIAYYLDRTGIDLISDKVDVESSANSGALTVSWDKELMSGTWSIDDSEAKSVSFYSVKGSDEFALYFLDPALSKGVWTTEHLLNGGGNTPELSHLTVAYNDAAPVPEPATMILLGIGLVGFAGFGRKKIISKA